MLQDSDAGLETTTGTKAPLAQPGKCPGFPRHPPSDNTEINGAEESHPAERSFDSMLEEIGLILEDSDTANSNTPLPPGFFFL